MDGASSLCIHKIFVRMLLAVVFPLINLACSNTVAKHFGNIADWHFYGHNLFFDGVIVRPIFKMMFISSLVMKPRGAVTVNISFCLIGTACTDIVFYPLDKFGGRIFRKVMAYTLPEYPRTETMPHYCVAVTRYCIKMSDCVFKVVCFHEKTFFQDHYITFLGGCKHKPLPFSLLLITSKIRLSRNSKKEKIRL